MLEKTVVSKKPVEMEQSEQTGVESAAVIEEYIEPQWGEQDIDKTFICFSQWSREGVNLIPP